MKRKLGIGMLALALPIMALILLGLEWFAQQAQSLEEPAVWVAVALFGAWVYKGVNLLFD